MGKILFLDESGDHNLSIIDPSYPIFVLGGVIVEETYAKNVIPQKLSEFKIKLFGNDNIILHTSDIVRSRNGFENLSDKKFRETFYSELNLLMTNLEYKVVACVVKKELHLARYGLAAIDPYMLSLDLIVERFCFELGNATKGIIIAESRDSTLNNSLELAWLNLKVSGTRYIQATKIKSCISNLIIRDKKENVAGLQLADLVVTPIGRYILGKPTRQDFNIIQTKLRGWPRNHLGMGLVVLPK